MRDVVYVPGQLSTGTSLSHDRAQRSVPANIFLTVWHPAQRQVIVCQHETDGID